MAPLSRLSLVLFLLLFFAAPLQAETETEVIPVKHRLATELIPVVQTLVGEKGTVTACDQNLIIRATSQDLDAIKKVLSQLDKENQTLRIMVRQSVRCGEVGSQRVFASDGDAAGNSRSDILREGGAYRLGNLERSITQSLQVLDGESALVTVGKEIPFTRELALVAGRHTGIAQKIDLRKVTTGFWIRPRLQGEEILLEITTHMALLEPFSEGVKEVQKLTTSARVPLGEWYNLSNHLKNGDEISRAILLWRAGQGSEEHDVWVKIEK
jgi:hypothetical protein